MDLQTRVKSEGDACVVAHSLVSYLISELVGSLHAEVYGPMWEILRGLGRHGTTAWAAVGHLVFLLQ
jgi:hypothetical protein